MEGAAVAAAIAAGQADIVAALRTLASHAAGSAALDATLATLDLDAWSTEARDPARTFDIGTQTVEPLRTAGGSTGEPAANRHV